MPQPSPAAAWESSLTNSLGLYIHIPFCLRKCNYCSFYSVTPSDDIKAEYVKKISEEIKKWGGRTARPIDTLYIGGGTPSLLSERELTDILTAVRKNFNLLPDAEITVEANPGDNTEKFLGFAKNLGVNRISIGVQSADDGELDLLGRRHSFDQAVKTVQDARKTGFDNISADIMIGLPDSNTDTLKKSLDGILSLAPEHISAYILKIEEGTPFFRNDISLPSEDEVADQYLIMCEAFEKAGYEHYEISNFAKRGYESRHNNRYWLLSDYIGIGPAAHSFFEGKRFYYPADLCEFLKGDAPVPDGEGGDSEEFIMLSLRLSRGLVFSEYEKRFGHTLPEKIIKKAKLFEKQGLCRCDSEHIALTNAGMLVSNSIIGEFI